MDKLGAMNAFAKVVALGSFAEAARALGTTRSAASKAVMELEHVLGVRLLDRTTRRVRATEAGLAYYERCVDILARIEETEMQVARLHDEPRGVLRLNGPASFGALYLAPAVSEFIGRHPKIKIEEGADVTIRIADLADSSLIARKLAPARRAFVVSPSYVASRGEPMAPEDLARHACLTYGHTTTLQRRRIVRDGEATSVPVDSVLCSNSGDVLRAAALAGRGVALLPTFLIGPDIDSGALRTVLDRFPQPALGVHALYASNRYLAAKTRAFIDFLAGRFGDEPVWDRFRRSRT
jgi:DNA-binding transcriptional LysR family regulator